jgi:hypothetical protein
MVLSDEKNNIHAGLAVLLVILLIIMVFKQVWLLPWAIGFLVVLMAVPKVMTPLARVWFLFSEKLGNVMSKVILVIIFYVVVFPMSIMRSLLGADPMQFKKWKRDGESVFRVREGNITAKDLETPY